MRTLLIALMLAGAVAAYGQAPSVAFREDLMGAGLYYIGGGEMPEYEYIYFAEIGESADWEIRIFGASGQFYVWYTGYENNTYTSYVFKVDSLADVRPTPAEMEGRDE